MLKGLTLYNFRNYKSASFSFAEGINYIHGPNAKGKTTLLEAIGLFLMGGRSFRTHNQDELIREGEKSYHVELSFVQDKIPQNLSISYDGSKKRILHNGTPLANSSALFGILRGTILLPEDEMLIKGGPAYRRLYCDMNLAQLKPLYLYHLARYNRALKQRNALLKQKQESHLALFEKEMALSASYLTSIRNNLILALNQEIALLHPQLCDHKEELELTYLPQITLLPEKTLEELFLENFEKERKRGLLLGYSTFGPHRDDLLITLSKKEAKQFASEGQKRLATTTLRLAQWHHVKKESAEQPLLCIDDVGLALDSRRKELLYSMMKELGQLFLTSSEPPPHYLTSFHSIAC